MNEDLREKLKAIKAKVDKNPLYRPSVDELAFISQAAVATNTVALGERILKPYTKS